MPMGGVHGLTHDFTADGRVFLTAPPQPNGVFFNPNINGTYRWLDDRTIAVQFFGAETPYAVHRDGDTLTLTDLDTGLTLRFRRLP
jgi:hypothetical protein